MLELNRFYLEFLVPQKWGMILVYDVLAKQFHNTIA